MTNFSGFVNAAVQLGLTSLVIRPVRGIIAPKLPDGTKLDDIFGQAVILERHIDVLEITEHPVESKSVITDHAFMRPMELSIQMAWSLSPSSDGSLADAAIGAVAANVPASRIPLGVAVTAGSVQSVISGYGADQLQKIYDSLLILQKSRAVFNVFTGKRMYANMLCRSLAVETDVNSENSLFVNMECQEVILVNTQVVPLSKDIQASPENTGAQKQIGQVRVSEVAQ